jgi:hypothetical protein
MSSWCTEGQLYLLLLFWRNDCSIYRDVILSHRKWGRCGVMEQYCVVSKHRMLLSDDQCWTWKLGNLCAMLVFLLCNAHVLSLSVAFSSALALCRLLFGLMIWQLPHCVSWSFVGVTCLDWYWPQHLASPKVGVCLCVFSAAGQFRISPCIVDRISFTDREEERPITTLPFTKIMYLSEMYYHISRPIRRPGP